MATGACVEVSLKSIRLTKGMRFALAETNTLGRGTEASIQLAASALADIHASVRLVDGQWHCRTEADENHETQVDGVVVPKGEDVALKDGARINLGVVELVFLQHPSAIAGPFRVGPWVLFNPIRGDLRYAMRTDDAADGVVRCAESGPLRVDGPGAPKQLDVYEHVHLTKHGVGVHVIENVAGVPLSLLKQRAEDAGGELRAIELALLHVAAEARVADARVPIDTGWLTFDGRALFLSRSAGAGHPSDWLSRHALRVAEVLGLEVPDDEAGNGDGFRLYTGGPDERLRRRVDGAVRQASVHCAPLGDLFRMALDDDALGALASMTAVVAWAAANAASEPPTIAETVRHLCANEFEQWRALHEQVRILGPAGLRALTESNDERAGRY